MNLRSHSARALENATLSVVSLAGLLTFCLPFIVSALPMPSGERSSRSTDASILLAIVLGGSLIITVGELTRGPAPGNLARSVALLGALVAIDASLRLIPSFLGASPIFALIVLVGYVFGPQFGFAMGALTLLLSAAITAGVGPWLPFQMLCAGWTGVGAGWLPRLASPRAGLAMVTAFGAFAGFGYGALLNLYSWPFGAPGTTSDAGLYWSPTLSFSESVERYVSFYLATSLVHDTSRALATALLILIAGGPVLRILHRYRARAVWSSAATS